MLQRPADEDDSTAIETGERFQVRERFLGLTPGQGVEVVDATDETTAEGEYPAELTLRLDGPVTGTIATSTMSYHGDDVKRAVDRGALELQ